MKTTCVLATMFVCAGCLIDREIGRSGGEDPGPLPEVTVGDLPPASAPPPVVPAPGKSPCCTIKAGPLMALDTAGTPSGAPSVTWTGTDWAVSWPNNFLDPPDPNFRFRNRQAPIIRLVRADAPGAFFQVDDPGMEPVDMDRDAFAPNGDYVLALTTGPYLGGLRGRAVVVDTTGVRRHSFEFGEGSRSVALARVNDLDAWAVVSSQYNLGHARYELTLLDNAMKPLAPTVELANAPFTHPFAAKVLSVDDKVITVVLSEDTIQIRTFVGRLLAEPDPVVILDEKTTAGTRLHDSNPRHVSPPLAATRLGDAVVLAVKDSNSTRTWSYRLSTRTVTDGPSVVGAGAPASALNIDRDRQGAYAGLCFPVGRERAANDPVEVKFALVGPDGKLRGQPVTIANDLRNVVFCDVAAGRDGEYLVAFYRLSGMPIPRMLAARVELKDSKPTIY